MFSNTAGLLAQTLYLLQHAKQLFLTQSSPADLHPSQTLVWLSGGYYALSAWLGFLFSYGAGFATTYALLHTLFVAVFIYTLLLARQLNARYWQTLTAIFAVGILFNLLSVPIVYLQMTSLARFNTSLNAHQIDMTQLQWDELPGLYRLSVFAALLHLFYGLVVTTQIIKKALSTSLLVAALTTFGYALFNLFVLQMLLYTIKN